jgi:hypothetical protein
MDLSLFDEVAEALRGPTLSDLGDARLRWHRYGIKLWFGGERPAREHYEAQVIGPDLVEDAAVLALEVGFHAEHADVSLNDRVIDDLLGDKDQWRRKLGSDAAVGPFLGRPDVWRRVSETWPDPDLDSTDLAFEVAGRLSEYVTALEPVRRRAARANSTPGRQSGRGVGLASGPGRGANTRRATSSSGGRSDHKRSTSSSTRTSAD